LKIGFMQGINFSQNTTVITQNIFFFVIIIIIIVVVVVVCNKLLCLTEIYSLYELDKHIGMTNVKINWKLEFAAHLLRGKS
jgi:hypothetical protein